MWLPKTWSELLNAKGLVPESPELDFKIELSKGREIAKDVAAMTLQGGVIAYGIGEVAEEDGGRLAGDIRGIDVAGVEEKIQQVVGSSIWPRPAIDVGVIHDPEDPKRGVVLVTVPPSPIAPHLANDRFPARAGTTTRYLAEREIEAFYEQRRQAARAGDRDALGLHADPPSRVPSFVGVGALRVVVRPVAGAAHPRGPKLARPLAAAAKTAAQSVDWIPGYFGTGLCQLAGHEWLPRGTSGWQVGGTSDVLEHVRRERTAYAFCSHDLTLSFFSTLGLEGEAGQGRCAYESLWAADVVFALAMAGAFLESVPGVSLVQAGVRLSGLEGAASYVESRGRAFAAGQRLIADDDYREQTIAPFADLADRPDEVARRLLDRLTASFLPEGLDLYTRMRSTV